LPTNNTANLAQSATPKTGECLLPQLNQKVQHHQSIHNLPDESVETGRNPLFRVGEKNMFGNKPKVYTPTPPPKLLQCGDPENNLTPDTTGFKFCGKCGWELIPNIGKAIKTELLSTEKTSQILLFASRHECIKDPQNMRTLLPAPRNFVRYSDYASLDGKIRENYRGGVWNAAVGSEDLYELFFGRSIAWNGERQRAGILFDHIQKFLDQDGDAVYIQRTQNFYRIMARVNVQKETTSVELTEQMTHSLAVRGFYVARATYETVPGRTWFDTLRQENPADTPMARVDPEFEILLEPYATH